MFDGIRVILEPACRYQGIEPTACALFWLVLPFREGGNYTIKLTQFLYSFQNLILVFILKIFLKFHKISASVFF